MELFCHSLPLAAGLYFDHKHSASGRISVRARIHSKLGSFVQIDHQAIDAAKTAHRDKNVTSADKMEFIPKQKAAMLGAP
jgi:hypothetical protein